MIKGFIKWFKTNSDQRNLLIFCFIVSLVFIVEVGKIKYDIVKEAMFENYSFQSQFDRNTLDPFSIFGESKHVPKSLIKYLPSVSLECNQFLSAYIENLDVYSGQMQITNDNIKNVCKQGGEVSITMKKGEGDGTS